MLEPSTDTKLFIKVYDGMMKNRMLASNDDMRVKAQNILEALSTVGSFLSPILVSNNPKREKTMTRSTETSKAKRPATTQPTVSVEQAYSDLQHFLSKAPGRIL